MIAHDPAPMDLSDTDIASLRFVAQGVSAELFALDDSRVAKLFRPAVSDEMIARESAMSIFADGAGLPVAPAQWQGIIGGRRAIVYPYVNGDVFIDRVRRRPMEAGKLIDVMASLHAAVHAVSAPHARPVKQVLETDILYGPASPEAQRKMVDYLSGLPDGDALLHGDFHLGNIMMAPQGPVVIDWSKAAAGHRAADVVRSEMLLRFGIGPSDWITNLFRDWAAARLRRAYLATSHVTAADLDEWRPVVGMAWLRARSAGRTPAFRRYLDRAMQRVGLPPLSH
ncbi:phosphotransferase family protein [Sphingobium sp.]|uniref:phosphotransferase family protein n=1 Tax=Sphingobium sp. TaxID=1912891 RepID=UPI003BB815B3